jgi:hypothetical protein
MVAPDAEEERSKASLLMRWIVGRVGSAAVRVDNWCWRYCTKRRPETPKYLSGKGNQQTVPKVNGTKVDERV